MDTHYNSHTHTPHAVAIGKKPNKTCKFQRVNDSEWEQKLYEMGEIPL